jgi:DNA-binding transcriptional LysR family regulator
MECLLAAITVAKTGSFSAAAQVLGVTHAAISRRIAGAETWSGVQIFHRHARGTKLTLDGERIIARVSQGIDLIDRAADPGKKVRRVASVRISTTASFAASWLIPNLELIERESEGVRIEVLTDTRLADIQHDEADLAIRYGDGYWRGVTSEPLFRSSTLVPALHRSFLKKFGAHLNPQQIVSLPLIHNIDSGPWRSWFAHHKINFRGRPMDRTFPGHDLAIEAAKSGLGVALLIKQLDASPLDRRLLLLDEFSCPDQRQWFLIRKQNQLSTEAGLVAGTIFKLARLNRTI